MPAIVLQNAASELLGFLLLAGNEAIAGGQKRDCVLTGVPRNSTLLDDPLSLVIQENKNVEFNATIRERGDDVEALVMIDEAWSFRYD